MEFANSPEAALQSLNERPFDAVVSDMRMPGMSGLELLDCVQERFPQVIRILLSGQADRDSILQSVACAHQYLSKPFEARQLREVLARTMGLTDLLGNSAIKAFVSRLHSIPSLPSLYIEVTEALRTSDPSPARVGRIVGKDIGMTAKILQVANSAIYGIRVQVTQPEEAVLLLGLDTVQSLVLSLSVFSSLGAGLGAGCSADALWHHSSLCGALCRVIARVERLEVIKAGGCVSAGLLHDIGKLVIASADPAMHRKVLTATAAGASRVDVEQDLFGCTHAEVGAYLLGIWGLPDSIVEAVAWHHRPAASSVTDFSALAAVHVASALVARADTSLPDADRSINFGFLEKIGKLGQLGIWMEKCEDVLRQGSLQ